MYVYLVYNSLKTFKTDFKSCNSSKLVYTKKVHDSKLIFWRYRVGIEKAAFEQYIFFFRESAGCKMWLHPLISNTTGKLALRLNDKFEVDSGNVLKCSKLRHEPINCVLVKAFDTPRDE